MVKCQVIGCPNQAEYYIPAECFEIRVRSAICSEHLPTYFKLAVEVENIKLEKVTQ